MRISDWSADVCSSDLDGMVSNMFGYHAIQIGLPHWDLLQANRIPYKWAAHGPGVPIDASGGRIVCDSEYLPFDSQSVDLLVLPHALECASDPHQLLREVERVLLPEGHVVITGRSEERAVGKEGVSPFK